MRRIRQVADAVVRSAADANVVAQRASSGTNCGTGQDVAIQDGCTDSTDARANCGALGVWCTG